MNNFIRKNAVLITIYLLLGMIMIYRISSMNIVDVAYDVTTIVGIISMHKK